MKLSPRSLAPAVALGALVPFVSAHTLAVTTVKDNTLFGDPPGYLSNGAGEHMFAGMNAVGMPRRALLEFDVSSIPAGSIVHSVSLRLHMSMTIAGPVDISLHAVSDDWGESLSKAGGEEGAGTLAWPDDATWFDRYYLTNMHWATPGGDYAASASDTQSIDGIGSYTWSSAQMILDVQGWLDDPATNNGWLMRSPETSSTTAKRFDTKENLNPAFHPRLVVDYYPPPGVPYCYGTSCPCGNDDASAGCANSLGSGARLTGFSSASVALDLLFFRASNLPPGQPALLFVGNDVLHGGGGFAFGDGLRCAGGSSHRLGARLAGATGDAAWGPGLGAAGAWTAGDVRRFQVFYRDPQGSPCGYGFNLTNGYQIFFIP